MPAVLGWLSLGGFLGVTSLSWLTDSGEDQDVSPIMTFGFIAVGVIGAALTGGLLIYAVRQVT
jgi:hypothetical protein